MSSLQRLENLFRLLLPPASREHVLGDLHEKCKSSREYLKDAASVLGPVIISRIRRTTDWQVFVMETLAVYLSFSAAGWWLGQKDLLYDHAGFVRLAIPTAVTLVCLLICNAYSDPGKQALWIRPILESAGSLALAFFGQAVIFDTSPSLAVPFPIRLYRSCMSLVLLATLRMLFPPIARGRFKVALLHETRNWQKPRFLPARATLRQAAQRIGDVQPSPKLKPAMLIAASLAAALLLVATIVYKLLR